MATATKKPREKLTLHETVELLRQLNEAVENHVDEIELNGGALPDWMAAMFDEVQLAMADRADAIAAVIDEMKGHASSAKATKDRGARREKVWNNVTASIKAYALREVERNGGEPIRGNASVLRIQANGQPSTECALTQEQLIQIEQEALLARAGIEPAPVHPLAAFITVQRVAKLDTVALAAAYEARQEELEAEAQQLLGTADFPEEICAQLGANPMPDQIAGALTDIRRDYVRRQLATEFPGVTCVRGYHLRID